MTNTKYEYFDIATGTCRSDGKKTERYLGGGKWKEIELNPYKRIDSNSDEYDFGETTRIDDDDVERTLKLEDYIKEKKVED